MITPLSLFDLSGKSAIVTGSTRGIGASLASALEAAGAEVYRHVRNQKAIELLDRTQRQRSLIADLSTPDGIDELASQFRLEHLDILINNAGVEIEEDSTALTHAAWSQTMTVNAYAPARLVGALLPKLLVSTAPSVVNVTSTHEIFPYPRHLAYSASKAALAMVTRGLAVELAPKGIRVNSLAPGIIETDINRDIFDKLGRETFELSVPLGRVGTPADLVGAALFLASQASLYVTGTTLFVDGGYTVNLARYETNADTADERNNSYE